MDTIKCSCFRNIQSKKASEIITLADFVERIKTHDDNVIKARAYLAAGNRECYDAAKKTLPAYTIGRTFDHDKRSNQNAHAQGVIVIDVDGIEPSIVEAVRDAFAFYPSCLLSAISCSGAGVFAVIKVDPDLPASREGVEALQQDVTAYLRSRFQDELSEKFGHVDASCKDLARLRITTFDPDCIANENATTWQGATDWGKPKTRRELIADKCDRAFGRSKLNELATLFGGLRDGKAGDAQVGAALTCLALASRGNVYGRVYSETYYPLRSQNVIVGKAGAGKTTMVMSLMDIAKQLGVKLIKPASDAALSHYVANAGAKYCDVDKVWKPKDVPDSLFEIVDEAGISRGIDKRRDYAAKMGAIRRELFGDKMIISSALTREAPDFPVPTRYTSIMLATTKSWADAMTADDAKAGDARRILEFWLPSACEGATSDEEAIRMIMQSGRSAANVDAIWEILEPVANRCMFPTLLPLRCKPDEAFEVFCLLEKYKHILGDMDERIAFGSTVFAVLAAHNAILRGSDAIEAEDLQVGAAIACGVLENRINIRNLGADPVETEEIKVIREIRQFMEGRSVRLDVLSRRYQSAQRQWDVVRRMMANGEIIKDRTQVGGRLRTLCRLATDEELAETVATREAKAEDEAQQDTQAEATTTKTTKTMGQAQAARNRVSDDVEVITRDCGKSYSECDQVEKENRIVRYLDKFTENNPIIQGNRDNAFNKLAFQLQAVGMCDEFAKQVLKVYIKQSGLSEREDKCVVLTSLIFALDSVDSTLGHYAAYLNNWSPRSFKRINLRLPRRFKTNQADHVVLPSTKARKSIQLSENPLIKGILFC